VYNRSAVMVGREVWGFGGLGFNNKPSILRLKMLGVAIA